MLGWQTGRLSRDSSADRRGPCTQRSDSHIWFRQDKRKHSTSRMSGKDRLPIFPSRGSVSTVFSTRYVSNWIIDIFASCDVRSRFTPTFFYFQYRNRLRESDMSIYVIDLSNDLWKYYFLIEILLFSFCCANKFCLTFILIKFCLICMFRSWIICYLYKNLYLFMLDPRC